MSMSWVIGHGMACVAALILNVRNPEDGQDSGRTGHINRHLCPRKPHVCRDRAYACPRPDLHQAERRLWAIPRLSRHLLFQTLTTGGAAVRLQLVDVAADTGTGIGGVTRRPEAEYLGGALNDVLAGKGFAHRDAFDRGREAVKAGVAFQDLPGKVGNVCARKFKTERRQ